jgi:hypothetical protein
MKHNRPTPLLLPRHSRRPRAEQTGDLHASSIEASVRIVVIQIAELATADAVNISTLVGEPGRAGSVIIHGQTCWSITVSLSM